MLASTTTRSVNGCIATAKSLKSFEEDEARELLGTRYDDSEKQKTAGNSEGNKGTGLGNWSLVHLCKSGVRQMYEGRCDVADRIHDRTGVCNDLKWLELEKLVLVVLLPSRSASICWQRTSQEYDHLRSLPDTYNSMS